MKRAPQVVLGIFLVVLSLLTFKMLFTSSMGWGLGIAMIVAGPSFFVGGVANIVGYKKFDKLLDIVVNLTTIKY